MALLIHKNEAYNLYSTVSDGPLYEWALTLEQLKEVIPLYFTEQELSKFPARLDLAHKNGCSHPLGWTLEECIGCNRAGPKQTHIPTQEFIAKFLTLPN